MTNIEQGQTEESAKTSDTQRFIQLFKKYIGMKLILVMLLVIALGVILIWISFKHSQTSSHYYILREMGKALFVTALISVPVKWYLTRQFDILAEEKNKVFHQNLVDRFVVLGDELKARFGDHDHSIEEIIKLHDCEVRKGIQYISATSHSLIALAEAEASRVYSGRSEAADDIHIALEAEGVDTIQIIGISLNDFLRDEDEEFHNTWKMLADSVRKKKEVKGIQKLKIHLLLIDPDSRGAYHRARAEERDGEPTRLWSDLQASMEKLYNMEVCNPNVEFEARIYRLPPMVFLVRTNFVSFVQHYYFRPSHEGNINIPLLKYHNPDMPDKRTVHAELGQHFTWIWEKASITLGEYFESFERGVDTAIREANVQNMYFKDSDTRRKRLRYVIENSGGTVWIKGVSLRSFFRRLDSDLYVAVQGVCQRPRTEGTESKLDVRILLLDPNGEQALVRSFREYLLIYPDAKREEFRDEIRKRQPLYKDTETSIENIREDLIRSLPDDDKKRVSVRLFKSAPEAFMLITNEVAVVEQYHYGKVRETVGRTLSGDVPLIEYRRGQGSLYEIFKNSFEYVYDYWSGSPL